MIRKVPLVFMMALLFICMSSAQAKTVISFNIGGAADALAPTDIAGLVAVGNWNNIGEPTTPMDGGGNFGRAVNYGSYTGTIVDSTGTAILNGDSSNTIQIQYNGGNIGQAEVVTGPSTDKNTVMMHQSGLGSTGGGISTGWLNDYAQIQISTPGTSLETVMGGAYKVIVYYGNGGNTPGWGGPGHMLFSTGEYTGATTADVQGVPSSTVFASVPYTTNGGPSYSYTGWYTGVPTYSGAFVQGNWTGAAGSGMTQGNYVQATGVTASNLVITPQVAYPNQTSWNYVSILGIQLVGPDVAHLASDPTPPGPISFDVSGPVGGSLPSAVTLTNDGDLPVTLAGGVFNGTYASHFSLGGSGNAFATMDLGNSQVFDIVFDRTGLAVGTYTSTLTFTTNVPGQETLSYDVSVNVLPGLQSHLVSLPDPETTTDFGVVSGTMASSIYLYNDGDPSADPAVLTSATFVGDPGFSLVYGDIPMTINPGDPLLSYDVMFDSTGLPGGVYHTALTFATNLTDQPFLTYYFTATVEGAPPAPIAEPAGLGLIGLALLGLRKRRS